MEGSCCSYFFFFGLHLTAGLAPSPFGLLHRPCYSKLEAVPPLWLMYVTVQMEEHHYACPGLPKLLLLLLLLFITGNL